MVANCIPQVPAPSYDYQYQYQQWVPSINTTQMSAEISKLLGDLFDKRLKHNKT